MVDCRYVSNEDLAERYLNGQLAGPLLDEFEVHLLECPECLGSLESLRELRCVVAREAPRIRLAPERSRSRFWIWSIATASLLILATLALFQWHKPGISMAKNQPRPSQQSVAPQPSVQHLAAVPTTSVQKRGPEAKGKTSLAAKGAQSGNVRDGVAMLPSPAAAPQIATQIEQTPATFAEANPVEVQHHEPSKSRPLTSAQANELYKLAEVHPAQYSPAERGAGSLPSKAAAVDAAIANGSTASVFQKAMIAYMQADYGEAREMLESAALSAPESATINYYLGVSSLLNGRTDEGIGALNKVIADGKSKFVQGAYIYLAKAYLLKADLKHAEEELALASNMPGRLTTEASLLLSRVHALRTSVENAAPDNAQ